MSFLCLRRFYFEISTGSLCLGISKAFSKSAKLDNKFLWTSGVLLLKHFECKKIPLLLFAFLRWRNSCSTKYPFRSSSVSCSLISSFCKKKKKKKKNVLKNRYRIVWSLHQFKFFFIDLFYFLSLSPFVSISSLSSPFVSISSLPPPSFFSFSPHLFPPPSFISITLSYSPILSFYRFIFARLTRPNCYYKNHLMLFFSSFLWLSEDSWFFCFHQNAPPTAKSPSNNNLIFSSCWETRMAVKNQLNRMYLLLFMAIFWWSTLFF